MNSFPDAPHMGGGPSVRQTLTRLFELHAEIVDNPSKIDSLTAAIIAAVRSLPPASVGAPSAAATTADIAGLLLESTAIDAAPDDTVREPAGLGRSAVRFGPGGSVLEPASDTFDVTVAPGEDVQTAVDRCPHGGSVLLQPGTHAGPLVLTAGRVVHVFGRGRAMLRTAVGEVIASSAATSTIAGLSVRTDAHTSGEGQVGILITAGRLRVQECDVSSQSRSGICVKGPSADPFIVGCRVHHGARACIALADGCRGTFKGCQ